MIIPSVITPAPAAITPITPPLGCFAELLWADSRTGATWACVPSGSVYEQPSATGDSEPLCTSLVGSIYPEATALQILQPQAIQVTVDTQRVAPRSADEIKEERSNKPKWWHILILVIAFFIALAGCIAKERTVKTPGSAAPVNVGTSGARNRNPNTRHPNQNAATITDSPEEPAVGASKAYQATHPLDEISVYPQLPPPAYTPRA
ncbi:hypothetical protein QBC34DRAFT_418213 [Podospora aff. communis PSN243]|uniref:Transmembrane protein n=1 Tax=Podospora aff. communis PSN243 TaxID=3040156 RepID=A0AAV9G5L3_9PEZI|nr:hypothetical protein QBC34DRAFT_418213 [Podospora aff. communis PSN243]